MDLPSAVNAMVEIPRGRVGTFEVDKKTGAMRLDRYLYSSSRDREDYGFIPQTLAADGDALDVLVRVSEPMFSGCLIAVHVVDLFRMSERGMHDCKVPGVPNTDPLFAHIRNLKDDPARFLREAERFFATRSGEARHHQVRHCYAASVSQRISRSIVRTNPVPAARWAASSSDV
ncbi:MAG: inorganic diphosphatase [Phycisphaerae bacterium]